MHPEARTQHIRIACQKNDYPTQEEAFAYALNYGKSVSRLPYGLRWNLRQISVSGGNYSWGANAVGELIIHTGAHGAGKETYHLGNIVDETMVHEGGHSALDVWISCLLYTSPSPRDRTRSRMPSSA